MLFPVLKTNTFLWVPSLYKHHRLLIKEPALYQQNLWREGRGADAIQPYSDIIAHYIQQISGENPKCFKILFRMTHKHHPHPLAATSQGAFTMSGFPAGFSSWFIWLKGCAQKFNSTTKWRLLVCSSVTSLPSIKYHCLPRLSPCLNIAFFWLPQTVTDAADTHALTQHVMWTVNRQ